MSLYVCICGYVGMCMCVCLCVCVWVCMYNTHIVLDIKIVIGVFVELVFRLILIIYNI